MVRASPKKAPNPHPTYSEMVRNALSTCRGFQKMSRQAVSAFIKSNYGVDNRTALNKSLKALVETGIVSQAKASYKLAAGQRPNATTPSKPVKAPSKPSKAPPKKAAASPAKKKATSKASANSKKVSPKKSSSKGKKGLPTKKAVTQKKASTKKTSAAKKKTGKGGGKSGRS
ncbi:Histone H5A, putative [Perkinsus marinus ATCC 50983]|uniref:Histone H5A, putative n=1 Tax=Perkinsus marinus (strain ATCC 50983 / TXsc) TaxID=423536 RepID=C5L6A8_PERM5|nr:Histone H5A, putative [Perkinsus marinus ATCC 50983]EER07735.1 Histone H5A, putative [Perkinsus marinus ATCC 50983]|eukprot:XP_002775919.1 Histone H5A, putative [Perkinsus marinus ATCC 50983]